MATTVNDDRPRRLVELDVMRGIAVIGMVLFHFRWDIDHFGIAAADMLEGPWYGFGRVVGASFVFIMGMSLVLADARKPRAFRFYLRRAVGLLALGFMITTATAIALPEGTILFGILHLLGVMALLLWWLRKLPAGILVVLGCGMVIAGFWLNMIMLDYPWLIWLGVLEDGRYMVDWYPLLPWGGFGVLGIAAGKLLFVNGRPRYWQSLSRDNIPAKGMTFLGRHPLIIYLVHQPVLFGMFWLAGYR
jgi:uncharacterized membrane protein